MLKKKITVFALVFCLLCSLACVGAAPASAAGYPLPEKTKIHASSAILVSLAGDPKADVILYEKKAGDVHAPGSMMRYMVLAYALHRAEEKGLDPDKATGTYKQEMFDRYVAGTGVPTANMNFGEKWKLRDLMAVSFMQSASDTLVTLAVAIDGSVSKFIAGMNTLAKEIGCEYSHFSNLTGLDSLGQYTTARDMYRIVRYCQQFSAFEDLAGNYMVTVKPVSGGQKRTIVSANELLQSSSPHYYSPIVHSRTGLSEHEGRTCASVARDSGYEYLVVVLGCKETPGTIGCHYTDTKTLFRWAFNQFEYTTVLAKSELIATVPLDLAWSTDRLNLVPANEVATVVDANLDTKQIIRKVTLNDDRVKAPVKKGDVLGRVELIINVNQKIGEADLVAGDTVNRSFLLWIWSGIAGIFTSVWFWLGFLLLVLLLGGYIVLNIVHNRRRRRQRLNRVKYRR